MSGKQFIKKIRKKSSKHLENKKNQFNFATQSRKKIAHAELAQW